MRCPSCSLPNYESSGHTRHLDCILIQDVERELRGEWCTFKDMIDLALAEHAKKVGKATLLIQQRMLRQVQQKL